MAIIVDKEQKRKDIALSCKELIFKNGINNLTVSQMAKVAGVGKGTIYDYFKNKEDVVFEIVNIMMLEYNTDKQQRLSAKTLTRDKVKEFANFFYDDEYKELRAIYKEFISISLATPNEEIIEFNSTCTTNYLNWFEEIIKEGIAKGELKEGSEILARGLFTMAEGMFITSSVTSTIDDLKLEIHKFTDALFDLIEVKDV